MKDVRVAVAATLFIGLLVRPAFLGAHHEAIFGPQSSLILSFLMGVGAFELNNGTIDHRAWSGPADSMGAVLGSMVAAPYLRAFAGPPPAVLWNGVGARIEGVQRRRPTRRVPPRNRRAL
jgi:hypothetical protein